MVKSPSPFVISFAQCAGPCLIPPLSRACCIVYFPDSRHNAAENSDGNVAAGMGSGINEDSLSATHVMLNRAVDCKLTIHGFNAAMC